MIPDLPLETYKPLGNTSLTGASMALLSVAVRDEIYKIRDRITYLELNVNQVPKDIRKSKTVIRQREYPDEE